MSVPGSASAPSSGSDTVDVLVVGAGPAGSSAASWAARAGREVLLVDSAAFPRDKTCGDGLTPRALAELHRLGLGDWALDLATNRGLRLSGFGREVLVPWSAGSLPRRGSAVARSVLDDRIRSTAVESGASMLQRAKAIGIDREGDRVRSVRLQTPEGVREVRCRHLVVADGVRSPLGKMLGRSWHRETVYGVAARAYVDSDRSTDEWISSHLEVRSPTGELLPGYGWVFPLGSGGVNIGVGSLATARRPARGALRPTLDHYAAQRRSDWELRGELRDVASALLPMGGAVSGVAGRNWALVGDAAACVNPLNGEGIDYGLEGGRLVAGLLDEPDWSTAWPATLREHYGAAFSLARRMAALLTLPRFLPLSGPVAMRSHALMDVAVRLMGNLVTENDHDVVARLWRTAGRGSLRLDRRPLFD